MKKNQTIVIIDYGAGNIQSILFAIERLGYNAELSNDPATIKNADKVIFPGVGEASSAMKMLCKTGLDKLIPQLKQPVLGICVGMQLMCKYSEEGDTKGLAIFDAEVVRFPSGKPKKESNSPKVPQIQWNTISNLKSPLFAGIAENAFIYMVHSYYAPVTTDTIAITAYGVSYSSALANGNFYGTQFHPEKSSRVGETILKNFLEL